MSSSGSFSPSSQTQNNNNQNAEEKNHKQFNFNKDKKETNKNFSIIPVYIIGFMDLLGVSMVLPLIGTHVKEMGASPTMVGMLGSVYGALQLFSSPIIGKWSDIAGRRFSLILCLIFSAFGYCFLGFASSILVLFLARIPSGIFKHSLNICKSYIADVVPASEQSAVLGRFNAASSVGFILGPTVGGHIAERPGGFFLIANLAGIIFVINAVIVWFLLPIHHQSAPRGLMRLDSILSPKKLTSDEIQFNAAAFFQYLRQIHWAQLWDMFIIRFLLGFSIILFRSNFGLMLKTRFNVSPVTNGYLISYTGTVSTVCAFLVGTLTKFYKDEAKLFLHMALLQVFILLFLGFCESLMVFIGHLGLLSIASSVMRVTGTRLLLQRGGPHEGSGTLMGLNQSFMSIARMISPFIAGMLMEINVTFPAYFGCGATLLASLLIVIYPQDVRVPLGVKINKKID